MKLGLTKMLRSPFRLDDMVDSASLLVEIYLFGRIGAPADAEMYTKVGTCSNDDSCANAMARDQLVDDH
jgi:hypothetical protein